MLNRARRDTPVGAKKAPRPAPSRPEMPARIPGSNGTEVSAIGLPVVFRVGELAVPPAHGVGQVVAVESRALGPSITDCYILKMLDTGLTVMVPTEQAARVGLRPVMQTEQAQQ